MATDQNIRGRQVYHWLKSKLSAGLWSVLAAIIVFLIAGPEIMISMELYAMVETLGASTFVLAYFAGLKLYLKKPYEKLREFEHTSAFFVPTVSAIKQMPAILIHAVPERLFTAAFVGSMSLGIFYVLISI